VVRESAWSVTPESTASASPAWGAAAEAAGSETAPGAPFSAGAGCDSSAVGGEAAAFDADARNSLDWRLGPVTSAVASDEAGMGSNCDAGLTASALAGAGFASFAGAEAPGRAGAAATLRRVVVQMSRGVAGWLAAVAGTDGDAVSSGADFPALAAGAAEGTARCNVAAELAAGTLSCAESEMSIGCRPSSVAAAMLLHGVPACTLAPWRTPKA
jgi:hypothetical protein